jgi:hypothetical protein
MRRVFWVFFLATFYPTLLYFVHLEFNPVCLRRRIEERRELERHTVAAFWKAGVEFPRSGPDETQRSLKNEIQKSGSAFDSF